MNSFESVESREGYCNLDNPSPELVLKPPPIPSHRRLQRFNYLTRISLQSPITD